jgi:hypothetical protein
MKIYQDNSLKNIKDLAELQTAIWKNPSDGVLNKTKWAFLNDHSYLLTCRDDEVLVGARGAMIWPLHNVSCNSWQFHGTCVNPKYQRRGIFSKMNLVFLDENPDDLVYNVSVERSMFGYKKLGWHYRHDAYRLTKIYKPFKIIRRLKQSFVIRRPEPTPNQEIDFSLFEDLFKKRREFLGDDVIQTAYDQDFIKWRLSCVDEGYKFFVFEGSVIVYKLIDNEIKHAVIGEVFLKDYNYATFKLLLKRFRRDVHPDLISTYISLDHGLFRFYKKSLFFKIGKGINWGVMSKNDKTLKNHATSKWALSYLDIDTF